MKKFAFLLIGVVVGGIMIHLIYQFSGFTDGSPVQPKGPKMINAVRAKGFIDKYHRFLSPKLKTRTENGREVIESIIIRQSIIDHFSNLVGIENTNNPRHQVQKAGLCLTLGKNENGATLIVTALVCDVGTNCDQIADTRHLLPPNGSNTEYIYDHLDLCPSTCPKKSAGDIELPY